MPEEQAPGLRPPTSMSRAKEADQRTKANTRIQNAVSAIAAMTYGLVHSLEGAIRRNRTHGWADDNLRIFRLQGDEEVRLVGTSQHHIVVRSDRHGRGLSDRECNDFSPAGWPSPFHRCPVPGYPGGNFRVRCPFM